MKLWDVYDKNGIIFHLIRNKIISIGLLLYKRIYDSGLKRKIT